MTLPRLIALAAATFLIGSCSPPGDNSGGTTVTIYDNSFNPQVVHIPVGTRLAWVNTGRVTHTAIALDSSWAAEAGTNVITMNHDDLGEYRFDKAGVYRYYCNLHGTKDGKGMSGVVVVGDAKYEPEGAKGALPVVDHASGITRRVPSEYATIQSAVDAANPGDLVLVDKGVYKEEVKVTTPSLVIRGVDRNETIIDGEFVRGNGIMILADAVAVENMTARNNLLNGFFWTELTGFRGSYLTAYNNGDYGIYAFDASDGLFEDSYASGSPDSGFYVGQCFPCHTVIRNVVAENNGLGFSGTNAGGDFYVVSSIWRHNRTGLVPSSLDIELNPPQHGAVFAANLVTDNDNRSAPTISLAAAIFGNGIINAGGVGNRFERNVVINHPAFGILMTANLDRHFYPAQDNVVRNNRVYQSGIADLAVSGPRSTGNRFIDNVHSSAAPAGLAAFGGDGFRLPLGQNPLPYWSIVRLTAKAIGIASPDFRKQPAPPLQPTMPDPLTAPPRPAYHVWDNLHFDLDKAQLPVEAAAAVQAAEAGTAPATVVRHDGWAHRWGIYLVALVGLLWIVIALVELGRRSDLGRSATIGWVGAVIVLPFLGAAAYLAGASRRSGATRASLLGGGVALAALIVAVTVL